MAVARGGKPPDKEISFIKGDQTYQLRFFEGNHTYYALGGPWQAWTRVPSTTGIAKLADPGGEPLLDWAARLSADAALRFVEERTAAGARYLRDDAIQAGRREPAEQRQKAGAWGSRAHEIFEHCARNPAARLPEPFTLDDAQVHHAIASWWVQWNVKPVLSEFMALHPGMAYAGTGDLLAFATDPENPVERLWYFDLKTGTRVYPSHFAQIGGYKLAHDAMGRDPWNHAGILHLPIASTEIKVHRQTRADEDQDAFMAARVLYAWGRK